MHMVCTTSALIYYQSFTNGVHPMCTSSALCVTLSSVSTVGLIKESRPRSEQSDLDLHCLPFRLHLLASLLYERAILLYFRIITTHFSGVRIFWIFTVHREKAKFYFEDGHVVSLADLPLSLYLFD